MELLQASSEAKLGETIFEIMDSVCTWVLFHSMLDAQ